jgi:anti-sigma factor (TIGR02949 family)
MRLLQRLRGELSCQEVLEVLQAHLDGEVDDRTARRVAAHLDKCNPCHHEAAVYEEIKAGLARRRRPVDPEILDQLGAFGLRLTEETD